MIRLIAAAGFVVAVATSAQAITPAPIPQPDGMITQVRLGCGHELENLVLACVQCNQEKYDKTLDEYRAWRRKNRMEVLF